MTLREKLKAVVADVDRLADEAGYEPVWQEFFIQIVETLNLRGCAIEEILRFIDEHDLLARLRLAELEDELI